MDIRWTHTSLPASENTRGQILHVVLFVLHKVSVDFQRDDWIPMAEKSAYLRNSRARDRSKEAKVCRNL